MGREGIIIGAGASGLMAAITAAQRGASVTVLEHMPRPGKKLLATGNGKCNLTNLQLDSSCYRCSSPDFPMNIINAFPVSRTLRFFRGLGILTIEKNGYVYPASEEAKSVLSALLSKAEELGVRLITDCRVLKAEKTGSLFEVTTGMGIFRGDFLILAAGSMAAKFTGSDGSGYELAKGFGHRVLTPLPALVQLRCRESFFPSLAGVRTQASVALYASEAPVSGKAGPDKRHQNGQAQKGRFAESRLTEKTRGSNRQEKKRFGRFIACDRGELQLTEYGISGIPVFQVSRYASFALWEGKQVTAVLDFFPSKGQKDLIQILREQQEYLKFQKCSGFLDGIFHKKLADVLLKEAGIRPEAKNEQLKEQDLLRLASLIKEFPVTVTAANSYDQAQVCMGGVDLSQVTKETLESRLVPGLYFAGEILDVDGICGGYNLQWAWSSGHAAGWAAAGKKNSRYR